MSLKIIYATPYSKGKKDHEYPVRYVIGKYSKGSNPHDYMVGLQVKHGSDNYISTSHYHTEDSALRDIIKALAEWNGHHSSTWISYIPPTVKKVT